MPSKIKFTLGATTWTASCFRDFSVNDPADVNVVVDYSEGGQIYTYDKGVTEQFFTLVFTKLSDASDQALRDFHKNFAVGPLNLFTYTDEDGVGHAVHWLDTRYPLARQKHNYNSGTIKLRKEI